MKFANWLKISPLLLALVACNSGPGTPAFTKSSPSRTPQTPLAPATATVNPAPSSGFQPVAVGQGPCVGVKDPTNVPTPSGQKQWSEPAQVVDPTHRYCAILTTEKGRIVVQLYPEVAPKHVNSFVFLAQQGFYDGVTWHRVPQNFVAQTGDPTGTGAGGPGYNNVPLETSPLVKYDREGVLGAARTQDPNSAGSQFFITLAVNQQTTALNPGGVDPNGYTIFGQVVEGMDVVKQITIRNPQGGELPPGDKLVSVRIVDLGPKQ